MNMADEKIITQLGCLTGGCLFVGVVGGGWDAFDNCTSADCSCPGPPTYPSTPGRVINLTCVETVRHAETLEQRYGMCIPISADHQPSPSKPEVCSVFVGKSDDFPFGWIYFRKDGGSHNKGHLDGFDPGIKNLLIIQAIGNSGSPDVTVAVGYLELNIN